MSEQITVEQALEELREVFPDRWVQVEVSERPGARVFMVRVYGKPRQGFWLPSLAECMAQVRSWKASQTKREHKASQTK